MVKAGGSGGNDQRPQLLALLAATSLSHLVVEHKDRCARCGVAYLQTRLTTPGRELGLVHEADAEPADLLPDFVASSTRFCARRAGRRRARRKTLQVWAALEVN